jgi:glycosyltransferase involved in cell wall biosynthesis
LDALSGAGLANVTVMLIGRKDVEFSIDGVRVISTGYLHDTELVNQALNAADVFVGPSLAETLGQVFLEASLAGVPSIGFSGSGVEDAIVDGVTGYLVDRTADALRAAIRKLYLDRKLCEEMGRSAYLYARNEFSSESSYLSLHSMLENLNFAKDLGIPKKISFI